MCRANSVCDGPYTTPHAHRAQCIHMYINSERFGISNTYCRPSSTRRVDVPFRLAVAATRYYTSCVWLFESGHGGRFLHPGGGGSLFRPRRSFRVKTTALKGKSERPLPHDDVRRRIRYAVYEEYSMSNKIIIYIYIYVHVCSEKHYRSPTIPGSVSPV